MSLRQDRQVELVFGYALNKILNTIEKEREKEAA